MAEWLKAHDSKSCRRQRLGGSNPLASARTDDQWSYFLYAFMEEVINVRFYSGSVFDSQGRININSYNSLLAGRTIMIYVTDENFDLIHVESYDGKPGVPKCAIRKIDPKGRVAIPKALRRGAKYALVSNDIPGQIVIKLLWEVKEPG